MNSLLVGMAIAAGAYPAAPPTMKCQADEFKQVRFCHAAPKRLPHDGASIEIYTVDSATGKPPALRMVFWLVSENYLGAKEAIFIIDGEVQPAIALKFESTFGGVTIEHADMRCEGPCDSLIRRITTAQVVKLRIGGRRGNRDTTIPNKQKDEFTTVLAWYDRLAKR